MEVDLGAWDTMPNLLTKDLLMYFYVNQQIQIKVLQTVIFCYLPLFFSFLEFYSILFDNSDILI